jgi:hypothetical protein
MTLCCTPEDIPHPESPQIFNRQPACKVPARLQSQVESSRLAALLEKEGV